METTYKNSWHKPGTNNYGPAMYKTDAKPSEYRGFLIYNRINSYGVSGAGCWDVVKDGVCIGQMAGPNGARQRVDQIIAEEVTA